MAIISMCTEFLTPNSFAQGANCDFFLFSFILCGIYNLTSFFIKFVPLNMRRSQP